MTSTTSTSNKHVQFSLTDLPSELQTKIVAQLRDSIIEDAVKKDPSASREEAARAAACGLARLNIVHPTLRNAATQAMQECEIVGMSATRAAIHYMAGGGEFRQKFIRLVESNKHLEVPFSRLSPHEGQIILEELSRAELTSHLEKVRLDLSEYPNTEHLPLPALKATMNALSQHGNPRFGIDLDLSYDQISDGDAIDLVDKLGQCKLSKLNLQANRIGDPGADAIAKAVKLLPRLTELNLANNTIEFAGGTAIADALPESQVAILNLGHNGIGTAGALAIAKNLPRSALSDLNLYQNSLEAEGIRAIAAQLRQCRLTRLNVSFNRSDMPAIATLAGALPHSPLLTHLDLSATGIEAEGAIAISISLQLPQCKLRELALSGNAITDKGATAIANALPQSRLANLILNDCEIEDEGITAIANALPVSSLQRLGLNRAALSDPLAAVIADAMARSTLTQLSLCDTDLLTAIGVAAIADKLPQSSLTSLDLGANELGEEGAAAIANRLRQSKLTELFFDDNGIGDEGAMAFAAALAQSKLIRLDLSYNEIGHEGAADLASALPRSIVSDLDMSRNPIADAGAAAFAHTLPDSRLANLDLIRTGIGDEGAILLAHALRDSKLIRLDLSNNEAIGDAGVRAINAALRRPNPPDVQLRKD